MLRTIWYCIKNKHRKLDTLVIGSQAFWDQGKDAGWLNYRHARGIISNHKFVDRLLSRLHLI